MSDARIASFNPWRFGIVVATALTLGGWAILTVIDRRAKLPEPETVEVCVATKDLPVGTIITPDDVATLVALTRFAKDSVPEGVVIDPSELHDKRIARPWRKGEVFKLNDLVRGPVTLPEGMAMFSISLYKPRGEPERRFEDSEFGAGCWVDLVTSVRQGNRLERVLLASDVSIIAINTPCGYDPNGTEYWLSLAVTRGTQGLLTLAKSRGCEVSVLLSNPVHPFDCKSVNVARMRQLLESLPVKTPVGPEP
jgi:hypothetical protein